MDAEKRARTIVAQVRGALSQEKRKPLLDQLAWPREVEERFFAAGAEKLPEVEYAIDRDALERHAAELAAAGAAIDGDDRLANWARRVLEGQAAGDRMLLAASTKAFADHSRALYGSATSCFFPGSKTNLDLGRHLLERLKIHGWDEARDAEHAPLGAEEFAESLRARAEKFRPRLAIEVALDERCAAKVLAGMKRVRVRPDATFPRWEADGLWHHEVETHALTAQNGAAQPELSFLGSGGPRTTRTQEGLAVFSELYNRTLTVHRLERLAVRVELVDMAERGASFLDLYRFLVERGSEPHDAYLDAQRVCRGGVIAGGAPFTKDACYLAGLLHVTAFLNAFVRGGFRDETEVLVSGRVDLEDVGALVELRALGILERPHYLPRWLRNWDTLLPYFAFSSFVEAFDIKPVEKHYEGVIELAMSASAHAKP